MTYLKQLWLNDNRLLRLPQSLPIKLQRLFLEANRISSIPIDTFRWGSQLRTLSLAGNVIDDVKPETYLPLVRLKSLDLSNNKLSYIASLAFLNNTQLRYLNLDRNPIQRLGNGCLFGLKALQTLSIAYVTSADVYMDDNIGRDLVSLVRLTLDSSPGMVHAFLASNRLLFELSSLQELGILNSNLVTLRSDFPGFFPESFRVEHIQLEVALQRFDKVVSELGLPSAAFKSPTSTPTYAHRRPIFGAGRYWAYPTKTWAIPAMFLTSSGRRKLTRGGRLSHRRLRQFGTALTVFSAIISTALTC